MSLLLIPTQISENTGTLPPGTIEQAREVDEFIVEDEKSARRFLKNINSKISQENFIFHLLNEHSTDADVSALLSVIRQQKTIGLLSEAGCPSIADPGAAVVRMAHEYRIRVVPLTGPSSIFLALMASGLNGQSFVFHGYLPREENRRIQALQQLSNEAARKGYTQIFMEAPYRNQKLFDDILKAVSPELILCIAADITSAEEYIRSMPVADWKKERPSLHKRPAIFLIGK